MSKNLVRKNGADLSLSALSSSMNLTSKLVSKNQDDFYLSWWETLPLDWKKVFYHNLDKIGYEIDEDLISNIKFIIDEMRFLSLTDVRLERDCNLDLKFLKPMKLLTSLSLEGEKVYGYEFLKEFNNLECLYLDVYDSEMVNHLSDLSKLNTLSLSILEYGDYDFSFLNNLISLESLGVYNYRGFGINRANVKIRTLDNLVKLRDVCFYELGIKYYPTLRYAESLDTFSLVDSVAKSLGFISENNSLKKLEISIGSDYAYSDICDLVNLEELSITISGMNDFSLLFLKNMSRLKKVYIESSSYENVKILDLIEGTDYRCNDDFNFNRIEEIKIPYLSNLFNEDIDELYQFKQIHSICKIIIE